jgi:predicted DNA binding protein
VRLLPQGILRFSASVRVIDCRTDNGRIQQLVEINARQGLLWEIVEFIKGDENVRDAHIVRTRRGRILGLVSTTDSTMCKTIEDVNCFCLTCPPASPSNPDGSADWVLAMTASGSLREFLNKLGNRGIGADVVRVARISDVEKLTPRQRRVIEYAFGAGFFEYPRRASLHELSKALGVSPSALGEVLTDPEQKIVTSYLWASSL